MFRLKFMPTPSGPLHLGHAWIVLLMEQLAAEFRHAGHDAELVVMIDTLTNDFFGVSKHVSQEMEQKIICDLKMLGVEIGTVLRNGDFGESQETVDSIAAQYSFQNWTPKVQMPPAHFLKIALLDAQLGITHIVRGADRVCYDAIYHECYELIGHPLPHRAYVPLLLTEDGKRINAGDRAYLLDSVARSRSKAAIWDILVEHCVKPLGQFVRGRNTSVQRILDYYWAAPHSTSSQACVGPLIEEPRVPVILPIKASA